ncbi:MAG: hypothetical protein HY313_03810 [Acidobacteria bacterium]|nr:hypothetical protein [Acidobacteriota bacterium]
MTRSLVRRIVHNIIGLVLVVVLVELQLASAQSSYCRLTLKSAEILIRNVPVVTASWQRGGCPTTEGIEKGGNIAEFHVVNECTEAASGTIGYYEVNLLDGAVKVLAGKLEPVDSPQLQAMRAALMKTGRECSYPPSDKTHVLPGSVVRALATEPDGTVWAGTNGGLARFQNAEWQVFTTQNSPLPPGIEALLTTPNGVLWVGTNNGLARFYNDQWQVFTTTNSGLPRNHVLALAAADRALWVGTDNGLARFDNGQWQVYTTKNSNLPNNVIHSLVLSFDVLWIGTGDGLVRIEQGQWQVYNAENSPLPGGRISELAVGADTTLYIRTIKGLAGLKQGQWQKFSTPLSRTSALQP